MLQTLVSLLFSFISLGSLLTFLPDCPYVNFSISSLVCFLLGYVCTKYMYILFAFLHLLMKGSPVSWVDDEPILFVYWVMNPLRGSGMVGASKKERTDKLARYQTTRTTNCCGAFSSVLLCVGLPVLSLGSWSYSVCMWWFRLFCLIFVLSATSSGGHDIFCFFVFLFDCFCFVSFDFSLLHNVYVFPVVSSTMRALHCLLYLLHINVVCLCCSFVTTELVSI